MPRKPVLSPGQIREAKDMYAARTMNPQNGPTIKAIAKHFKVSKSAVYCALKKQQLGMSHEEKVDFLAKEFACIHMYAEIHKQ